MFEEMTKASVLSGKKPPLEILHFLGRLMKRQKISVVSPLKTFKNLRKKTKRHLYS